MIPMTSNVALPGRGLSLEKLGSLPKSERRRNNPEFCIGSAGTQCRISKTGESLFLQGDKVRWIWTLRDGWAFRYQTLEDGRRQIVDFVLPGDIIWIGTSGQMPYGVEALSLCTWITMPREGFLSKL